MPARKPVDTSEIVRLYWEEGLTPRQIAERLDMKPQGVSTRLRRSGVKLRSKSEAVKLSFQTSDRKPREVKVPLKAVLRCRSCGWVWRRTDDHTSTPCPHCGVVKDARERHEPEEVAGPTRAKFKAWTAALSPEAKQESDRKTKRDRRKSLLLLVGKGKVECVNCGCNRPELLEINHKNGGGRREIMTSGGSGGFYSAILRLDRTTDDLELCCKVCNALHYLELVHGPLPYKIEYQT